MRTKPDARRQCTDWGRAAVLVAALLVGCAGIPTPAAEASTANRAAVGNPTPDDPFDVCRHHPAPIVRTTGHNPNANAAGHEAERLLSRRYSRYWTDVIGCSGTRTTIVTRVPGSRAFDRELREIGRRFDVNVSVIDTKFSRRTLMAAEDYIVERAERLKAAGADLKNASIEVRGVVRVGVAAHPERARRVLAAIADRIDVQIDNTIAVPA